MFKRRVQRPTSIKIGLSTWSISYSHNLGEPLAGITYLLEQKIIINSLNYEEVMIRSTLLHEILHCICYVYGFYPEKGSNLQEAVVSLFTVPLMVVMNDNPEVENYLFYV